MKLSIHLFRMLPLIVAGVLIGGVMSCKSGEGAAPENNGIAAINDTLRHGNIKEANRLTALLKETSLAMGDSMTWSETMVQQRVNAYYQG